MKKRYKVVLLSTIIVCIIAGCSTRPSNNDIKQAVTKSLKDTVPLSLAKLMISGNNATIEEVKIIKIGKSQKIDSRKYWPVKIHAKGSFPLPGIFGMNGEQHNFEGETEYNVWKDPYGKWVAGPSGI